MKLKVILLISLIILTIGAMIILWADSHKYETIEECTFRNGNVLVGSECRVSHTQKEYIPYYVLGVVISISSIIFMVFFGYKNSHEGE